MSIDATAHRQPDGPDFLEELRALLAVDPDGDLAWQNEALCAQTDADLFFPEKGGSSRDAKQTCQNCPVIQECLDYALANDERQGVWGGKSETERKVMQRSRSATERRRWFPLGA